MTLEAQDDKGLSVYWDYDAVSLNLKAVSGYEVVKKIRSAMHTFGPIQSFKMYNDDSSNHSLSNLRPELVSSGVTVINCPSNGQKGGATKMMIVDIIAHAWDNPAPRTIAIITGDRDLAYLIATLRFRKYQVVLISPSGTHASLTNQASVNLNWNTGIANIDGCSTDMDDSCEGKPSHHLPPSPHPLPSPHLPSPPSPPPHSPPPLPATRELFSFAKTDFLSKAQDIDPPMVELQGMPTRGRQKSDFPHSYEPDTGFNIFRNSGGFFPSSRVSDGIFGLGNGPLFSRPQPPVPARQARSDSAPPSLLPATHSPPNSPDSNGFGRISSIAKEKQRGFEFKFPITEPEDIVPQSSLSTKVPEEPHSPSVTGMAEFFTDKHPSPAKKVNDPLTSGTSPTHSSASSRNSAFSVIEVPTTAPTSAESVFNNGDTTERGKNPATVIVITPQEPISAPPQNPVVREMEKVSSLADPSSGKEETGKAISTISPPIQPQAYRPSLIPPSSSQKAPPPKETTINAQAGPSSRHTPMHVPPQFKVLTEILRQHVEPYRKVALPTALLARDPGIYKKAKVRKYTDYITAAVEAGLVREVITKDGHCISLTAQSA